MRFLTFSNKKQRFTFLKIVFPELMILSHKLYPLLIGKAKYLRECCALFFINIAVNREVIEMTVPKKQVLHSLVFLKNHSLIQANMLMEYTVIDFPGKSLRFEIILYLLSSVWNTRIKLRLFTNESISLLTVTLLYKVAFWQEREIWDMFGVLFKNHFDLRRILTDYGFTGHPLRKDFPLSGFWEYSFDDLYRSLARLAVSLAQEYRFFLFQNAWVRV